MIKKVLILGGSSDIGIELANIFINKNHYKISIHYNSNKRIKKNLGSNCTYIKCDFSNLNFNQVLSKFDKNYDIIINLVGNIKSKSFENFNLKSVEKIIRTNSILPLLIIRKSLNNMSKKKWGRIVNTSSVGVKFGGGLKTFEYSLSKHINEFIPSHVRKIASKNVFYNVIKIGLTNTKIHQKIFKKNMILREKLLPTKKMASPHDIASYIYYISSNHNKFITNEVINITGGE